MMKSRETAAEMAVRIIAQAENITLGAVGDIADAALNSLIAPPLAPFLLAFAAAQIPIRWVEARLNMGSKPMPDDWYPAVLGTATDDGKFFIGRLLKTNGRATIADAVRFLVIEKEAKPRDEYDNEALGVAEAKTALMGYYEANRTLFDKAVAATAGIALKAAEGAVKGAGGAMKAAMHKIRRGF